MAEPTMEEYMTKTREDYGSRIARPKFDENASFKLKGQLLKELFYNIFNGSDNEDANEHTQRVLEIVDLFNMPDVNQDQLMLKVFHFSLTRAASRWIRNEHADMQEVILFYKGLTSTRCRNNDTSDGLAAIQAQLNNLGREIKKVNENVYAAQVGGRYRVAALGCYQRDSGNLSYQEQRKTLEESLSKFMAEYMKRHDKNSNLIKEIRALMDVAIRNQGA
nr:hypothetical protein [Tanacetum cinerariifolium]